jgi:hypothetical protein
MHARVREGCAGATLGFARVSFPYFMSDAVFGYILDAVHLIADEGWKLLPAYRFEPSTGVWRHADEPGAPAATTATAPESVLARQLDEARAILRAGPGCAAPLDPPLPAEVERIRWFPLPGESLRR